MRPDTLGVEEQVACRGTALTIVGIEGAQSLCRVLISLGEGGQGRLVRSIVGRHTGTIILIVASYGIIDDLDDVLIVGAALVVAIRGGAERQCLVVLVDVL